MVVVRTARRQVRCAMTTLGRDADDTLDQGIREGTAALRADQRAAAKARRGPGVVRRVGRGAARVGAGAVRVGIEVLRTIAVVTAIGIGAGLGMGRSVSGQ